MASTFETDPYPGRPKILFIGLGDSTHTHSWIDLLSASTFNVRLFALADGGIPPSAWPARTYLPHDTDLLPLGLNLSTRKTFRPRPETRQKQLRGLAFRFYRLSTKALNQIGRVAGFPTVDYDRPARTPVSSHQRWLRQIINEWQPDIIHTLGLEPASEFLYDTCRQFPIRPAKWIVQLRGGSDLVFNRFVPESLRKIQPVLHSCDQIITDNTPNNRYLHEMNVREDQISSLVPIPGTGGVDVKALAPLRTVRASQSRAIVFPKGYELAWSKCLPVFEALQLCWDQIAPCTIHILNITPEVQSWFYTLPSSIRESCVIHQRVPREEFFQLLAKSRVLLIPSLVDGVPNSLYEAMALGALPIVSPLESISTVVEADENVLFARNLYPQEIAGALVRAMTDDFLVDRVVETNLELVGKVAERAVIQRRVIEYYESLAGKA